MRADRLLQIVALLRTHGQLTTPELARRLEVTPRTIWRDMEALSSAGVPVYADRGRSGGFRLLPGYRPAVEDLTGPEIEALLLTGTGAVDQMGLRQTLRTALRKLSGAVAPEHGRTADQISARIVVDAGGWWGEIEDLPCFATVQRAVITDHRVRVHYRPKDPAYAGVRTLDPYGLVQAAGTWYLIAAHRGRPRTYRVGRIGTAELLDEPSRRPPDLDVRALWRELRTAFAPPPSVRIRLEIRDRKPQEAQLLLAGVGSARPNLDDGDPMIMTAYVLGVRAAAAALAGLGDRVRVLDPPELITALQATFAAGTALYRGRTL